MKVSDFRNAVGLRAASLCPIEDWQPWTDHAATRRARGATRSHQQSSGTDKLLEAQHNLEETRATVVL